MVTERFFSDRDGLFAALLDDCSQRLAEALAQAGRATLLASGGSSPMPLYQQLARLDLDWSRIGVALVDERWVGVDHPASNEAFIRQHLLQHHAAVAPLTTMKTGHQRAIDGQPQCQRAYQQLPRPFDFTLLGMGADGHTASLFPAAAGLEQALALDNSALCAAIQARRSEVTGEFTERMSLTVSGLLQSKHLHVLITGEQKLAVYRRALSCSDHQLMPVSALLQQQQVAVSVYWAP